jgi:transmembrane sensor
MDTEKSLIAERAAEWLELLEHAGPDERKRFVKWLKESPEHVWEILLSTSTDIALRQLVKEAGLNASDFDQQPNNVLPIGESVSHASHAQTEHPRSSAQMFTGGYGNARRLAATIAFLTVALLTAIAIYAVSARTISTGPGEWLTARLADDTILRISPQTRVSVEITDHERVLRLARGNVMAYIAKDATRPFFVETDLVVARAIGTAFAVQRMDTARISITVKEGLVGVTRASPESGPAANSTVQEPIILRAGQQVQVIPDGAPLRAQTVDVDKELSWAQERLVFRDGMTLADAIREFNVRNRTQIQLLDRAIGQRRVVGVFDAADPMSFVKTLERSVPLSIIADHTGTLLLVSHPTEGAGMPQETVER